MDLSVLASYQNRQVVLNYYEDDSLWKRDGFEFDSISVSMEHLQFFKFGKELQSISIKDFPHRSKNNDFQDFFMFRDNELNKRIEVYFPNK